VFFGLSLIHSAGIGIGIGIDDAPALVSSIFLSISGGTFIYIACSEILIHEFSDHKNRYVKFFFFALGSACITLLSLLHKHE
jgi:zinc transporter ZupT